MTFDRTKVNKATWYLLPMFGKDFIEFTENNKYPYLVDQFNFVNCFIQDINKPYYDQHLFLLYQIPSKCTTEWILHCAKLKDNSNYITEYVYIYDDITYLVFCFKIPNNYYKDYNLILEGKYSEISIRYKEKILHFWKLGLKSRIATILYKNKANYWLFKFNDTIGECESTINIKKETIPEEFEKEINEIE
jgi:hypothetical protein